MTIQPPPSDETPPSTPVDDPSDAAHEPVLRAPGPDAPPVGAPRDEPEREEA